MTWLLRRLLAFCRRYRVRHDLYAEDPSRHPALAVFQVGELFPFKGTTWRVAMVRELPFPAIVLVPAGETRASLMTHLQKLRRAHRILSKDEETARATLEKRAAVDERGYRDVDESSRVRRAAR